MMLTVHLWRAVELQALHARGRGWGLYILMNKQSGKSKDDNLSEHRKDSVKKKKKRRKG